MSDYELDNEELSPPKPYTPERAAQIAEMMKEISDLAKDLI